MRYPAVILLLSVLITSSIADAVPPKIHVRWDDGGIQPIEFQNYEIVGTPESPNVRLLTGRNDWRVWSTDLGN